MTRNAVTFQAAHIMPTGPAAPSAVEETEQG